MPGRGHAYQITASWQDDVRRRLAELGWSQAELARRAGIRPPSLTALLKPGAIQTTAMPAINKVLGFPAPLDQPPAIVQEGAAYLAQLDDIEQGRWVERLRHAVEEARRKRK